MLLCYCGKTLDNILKIWIFFSRKLQLVHMLPHQVYSDLVSRAWEGSSLILAIYDCTREDTLATAKEWVEQVLRKARSRSRSRSRSGAGADQGGLPAAWRLAGSQGRSWGQVQVLSYWHG